MNDKQYAVLGLGVFGSTIAKTLSQYGCEVLAIDKDSDCVERIDEFWDIHILPYPRRFFHQKYSFFSKVPIRKFPVAFPRDFMLYYV